MSHIITSPSGGTPAVLDTPEGIRLAASQLAGGSGWLAIDVERAGTYRYSDSACLIQVRRGAGDATKSHSNPTGAKTFLFDPQTCPKEVSHALAGIFNQEEWILHAASSDLPSLHALGLVPPALFDTELAGRFLGLEKVSLAALVERECGVSLLKGHGHQNWSRRPLKQSWLSYAALDVEFLLPLAESLRAQLVSAQRWQWFSAECEFIRDRFADGGPRKERDWRHTKGISRLGDPRQLQAAKYLWCEREAWAQARNIAVSKVLKDATLIEMAGQQYRGYRQIETMLRATGNPVHLAHRWKKTIIKALSQPRSTYPCTDEIHAVRHTKQSQEAWWIKENYPQVWDGIARAKESMEILSADLHIPVEILLKPSVLRTAMVKATIDGTDIDDSLRALGAREWQRELATPLLNDALSH